MCAEGLRASDLLTDEAWSRIAVYPGFWTCDTCGEMWNIQETAHEAGYLNEHGYITDLEMLLHYASPCTRPGRSGTRRMLEGQEDPEQPQDTPRHYARDGIIIREGWEDHGLVIEHRPYYALCPEAEPFVWDKGPRQAVLDPGYESMLPMIPTYCLPADWFYGALAPYTVYAVAKPSQPITSCVANTRALYATIRTTLPLSDRGWCRSRETHKKTGHLLAPNKKA